jgi:hypothetical protein
MRPDFGLGKLAHTSFDLLLFFGQFKVHRALLGDKLGLEGHKPLLYPSDEELQAKRGTSGFPCEVTALWV